jgi:hypothetical protein
MHKLNSVDLDRHNLECLIGIGNEWRRSWFRISFTILIEQKTEAIVCLSIYIYVYIIEEIVGK